jgi:hypothetical protein
MRRPPARPACCTCCCWRALRAGNQPGGHARAALIVGLALFPLGAALLADLTRRAAERLHGRLYAAAPRFPAWSAGCWPVASSPAVGGWPGRIERDGDRLLITLGIATLWAMLTDRVRLTALLAALAVLTRPEAVILGGMLLVANSCVTWPRPNDRGRATSPGAAADPGPGRPAGPQPDLTGTPALPG